MQTGKSSPNKIPKTLFNAPERILKQKIQDNYGYPDQRGNSDETIISRATETALQKYYPKYCHTIHLDSKPKRWSVVSRIKQIKSIRHLEYDLESHSNQKLEIKKMKQWLKNKRKSVKSLPVIGCEEENGSFLRHITAMEMCSFFQQIETLNVCLPLYRHISRKAQVDFIPASVEDQIVKIYGRFWDFLKNVRHLEIPSNPNLWVILSHLQKSQRFLSSLQSFRLTIRSTEVDSSSHPRKIFQSFLRYPDVLKYVTHLNFQRFVDPVGSGWFHYFGDQIKSILDCCSNLQSLKFPIDCKLYSHGSDFASPKHYLTLAPLKSFNRLIALDLMVYDTWGLIKGFEPPLQLRGLALRLYSLESISSLFKTRKNFKGNEELLETKREKLFTFFEKFSRLTELRILQLDTLISNENLESFFAPMLQAVPKLEKFKCISYRSYEKNLSPLNLSLIFNETIPLNQLQSFSISQSRDFETGPLEISKQTITFNLPNQKFLSFPNMSSLNINAAISEDFDFRGFFLTFSEGSKHKEINLGKIHISSIASLLRLFEILKEAKQFSTLKISLSIAVFLQNWKDIHKYLKETIILAENVSADLEIYVSTSEEISPRATTITTLQKVFAKMKFTLTLLVEKIEGSGWSQYKRVIPVPVIRNNHYSALLVLFSLMRI